MARLGTKPPMLSTTSTEAARMLDKVSKAALIDLYLAALAVSRGHGDTPPSVRDIIEDANASLAVRGDRLLTAD